MPLSGIFPSSMVYHVYQMKIEFSINLVQSHTKPTPHGVGWGFTKFFAAKGIHGEIKVVTAFKALHVVTKCIFLFKHELIKK